MALLPLFPLPNVVLFPGVPIPLHIFEPRYRAMVADALEGDRRLGLVLLQPGWESDYEGRPPIYPIGCSGVIVQAATLDDGRYNIVLNGIERVRVINEDYARLYRRATIEPLPDSPLNESDETAIRELRLRIETLIGLGGPHDQGAAEAVARLASMPDVDLVHVLAHGLDLEPLEKQALLERENLRLRAQALVELLEMRKMLEGLSPMTLRPH